MNTTANTTRIRWWIAGLMWLAIAINYIDRTVLSAAAPHLIDELKLDPEMMGFIMAAFFLVILVITDPRRMVRRSFWSEKRSWFSRRLVVNCHLDDGCCHGF